MVKCHSRVFAVCLDLRHTANKLFALSHDTRHMAKAVLTHGKP